MNDDIYVLIPARKGSKRLLYKNMTLFSGFPLLLYSIDFAKQIGLLSNTYVSSNDENIISYSSENGVKTILRPENLSSCSVKLSDVILHFLDQIKHENIIPKYILLLQPTNPLRTKEIFNDVRLLMQNYNADCVFTAYTSKEKYGIVENGKFIPYNYKFEEQFHNHNSYLCESGTMYFIKVESLLETGSLFGNLAVPLKIEQFYRYNDIDEERDLSVLECIYNKEKEKYNFFEI